MNKERLNLNISTSTTGTVSLDPKNFKDNPFTGNDLKEHNLPEKYPVTVYRTYSIIADGRLQTKKLVVSDLTKETINALGSILTMRKDKKYIVDFTSLPIINKTYVKMTSGQILAYHVWNEKLLMDQISVYTYYKKETEYALGIKSLKQSDLTEEAAQFLATHCYIKNGTYNPPVKPITENDEYEAYKFNVKINGFTKAQASAVIKKLEEQKNTTQRELIIKEAYINSKKDAAFRAKGKQLLKNIEEKLN